MNEEDINYVINLLNTSIKEENWEYVLEALEYIQEFQEDSQLEEE